MHKKIFMTLLAALLLLGAFETSQAALQAVGPVSPATGYFPVWYQDATGAATGILELCLSKTPSPDPAAAGAPMCSLLPVPGFDPALPIVFPLNFPDESFWFMADANIVDPVAGVDLRFVSALEAAFGTGAVVNGDQISFARIRFFAQLPTPGTYTITHPFGVDTFVVDTVGVGREIQFTRDIGVAANIFTGALAGDIGPFLIRSNVAGGVPSPIVIGTEMFLGDPNVTQFATGSPFGTNYVRIVGPGIDLTTDQFLIQGKVFGGVLPPSLILDRATYSRAPTGSTLVEVFGTSAPLAPGVALSFRETVATGPETAMIGDLATGRFFKQYIPAALPANIVMTATRPGSPPTSLGTPVVDLVKVTNATYSLSTKQLVIEASSSDQLPVPTLTAVGWGRLSASPTGGIIQSLIVPNVPEPPARVTVRSSAGGSDTEPVVVSLLNIAPLAVNDVATTSPGIAAIINVLSNDSDPNANLPLTVVPSGLTQPVNGTVAVNIDQTITYTPNALFVGTDSFTYQAADSLGALSNVAIVTVSVNDAPVANPDTASTTLGVAAVIGVLANDTNAVGTLNPASVTVTTAALSGTTSVNTATGAITYTPNTGFTGADTFAYTVQDSFGAVSNAATVSVTVGGVNRPPLAVNDPASTLLNTAVIIPVLGNDSDIDGTLNPATVTIGTGPVSGAVSVNLTTGEVTYTPTLNFSGADSFTYTVQDNLGAVSNAATVNVTVSIDTIPPALTLNPPATPTRGISQTISGTVEAGITPVITVSIPSTAGPVVITGGTSWSSLISNLREGANTVTVSATDASGNTTTVPTATIILDTIPPALTLTPVTSPTAITSQTVSGAVEPGATVQVTLNGGVPAPATVTGGGWSFNIALLNAGVNTIIVTATDAAGNATILPAATITVTANAPPVAVNDVATTTVNTARVINVIANDTDVTGILVASSVAIASVPTNGIAVANGDGTVTYTPNAAFAGTDTFTYTVRDNLGLVSTPGTVTITVISPTAETVTVLRAQFRVNRGEWGIQGTATVGAPGRTITIHIGNTLTGPIVGTTGIAADGRWQFRQTGSTVLPDATNTISVESSGGGSRLAFPIAVR